LTGQIVLSRTLFVGGVSAKTNETELKNFFSEFGKVQSCIVNHDKRHAFLKLITHQDAIATKQTVELLPPDEYRGMFERVRVFQFFFFMCFDSFANKATQIGWAVGFGPTSCADYKEGLSTIPINVLTDADRKWMLNAEFGGTGGQPIATGMIVEEPDIEIGAGPSSKGMISILLLKDIQLTFDYSNISSRWWSRRLSWRRQLQSPSRL